ncbi:MAG TPA: cytochrome c oxidase subunit II [Acidimicrobiales bacterium]|nr:cytochrome c oxidase subunit II [Acidimicrobiales bacterium]
MANGNNQRPLRSMAAVWLVISVVGEVIYFTLIGKHIAPGRLTETAASAQSTFNLLFGMSFPVLIGVWVYMSYAIRFWSAKRTTVEPTGGDAARNNHGASVAWITITSVVVLFAAYIGTYGLIHDHGSGGGEGPNPVWSPPGATQAEAAALAGTASWSPGSNKVLPVQVIAQQWKFTYRYPTFGGFESPLLYLPADTTVAFNVTSLDVIHSFWAYQLGVKADANPGINNVAFTDTKNSGFFEVRCSELCGIWHGSMFNAGHVVSQVQFMAWAQSTESANAANTANLPAFAWTYTPDANGAAGGYYIDGKVTPYSPQEIYGAKQPAS